MPNHLDQETFKRSCAKYATGITVATVLAPDGTPHGLTANSFTSVSIDPPLVLFCIENGNNLLPFFKSSRYFGINVLRETQQDLSMRFAIKPMDRFDGIEWNTGATDVPILDGALAQFECRKTRCVEGGDHTIVIGEVVQAAFSEGRPIIYFDSAYQSLKE